MGQQITQEMENLIYQIKELESSYRKIINKYHVSQNEFWIWYALIVMKEEYSQQDISEIWGLPKQTINNIVSNMAKKGYITLEPVPNTKNKKKICVTTEGLAYGEELLTPICRAERKAFEHISFEDMGVLSSILEKLLKALKEESEE